MSDGYRHTTTLRTVLTESENTANAFGAFLGSTIPPQLQQLWTSSYVGEEDQWRDVPFVVLPNPIDTTGAKP